MESLSRPLLHPLNHSKIPSTEMRKAYNSLIELAVVAGGANTSAAQPYEECRKMYLAAFEAYNQGDAQTGELLARSVRHLCKAIWYDAKLKYLEGHSEDMPHLPGLSQDKIIQIEERVKDIENRLARLKLTGISDRFGGRARKHLERIAAMGDRNNLLAHTFLKASLEYCLATESLNAWELHEKAA